MSPTPHTTGNMGLTIWDNLQDVFDYGQLEDNFIAIDGHDHSSEKGVQIGTAGIQNGAITNALMALNSIANAQLQPNSVASNNIQNGAVGSAQLAANSITSANIEPGSINIASLDPNIVQLGHISLWWRPPGSALVPGGIWEIMDGRAWSTITNAWNLTTGNIPDMRGQFAQGADILGSVAPAIGATGGSSTASLAHSHGVLGHVHGMGQHQHSIEGDGNHFHTWQGGRSVWSRENAISPYVAYLQGYPTGNVQVSYYSMYIKNLTSYPGFGSNLDANSDMDTLGYHTHGAYTGANNVANTASNTSTTDSQLGSSTSIEPQNTALCYIMRCR